MIEMLNALAWMEFAKALVIVGIGMVGAVQLGIDHANKYPMI